MYHLVLFYFILFYLEYCDQSWRPHLQKGYLFEREGAKRATRLIPSFREVLRDEIELITLETRQLRGNLIELFEIFKICNGLMIYA